MKKRTITDNSKVREYMFYRTCNQVLIDNAMMIVTGLVGFGNSLDKSAEDRDAEFIRDLVRLPATKIANCSKLMEFHDSMRDDIVRLIIGVKRDLKGAV